jgi:hypothetical protein
MFVRKNAVRYFGASIVYNGRTNAQCGNISFSLFCTQFPFITYNTAIYKFSYIHKWDKKASKSKNSCTHCCTVLIYFVNLMQINEHGNSQSITQVKQAK